MAHGTDQAVAGLGDGSVIGTGGNAADADNRLASLASIFDIEASEVDVDSTSVFGTSTNVQGVLESITTEFATPTHTHAGGGDTYIFSAGVADVTSSYADTDLLVPISAAGYTYFKGQVYFTGITNAQAGYSTLNLGATGATFIGFGMEADASAAAFQPELVVETTQLNEATAGTLILAWDGVLKGGGTGGNVAIQVKSQDGSGIMVAGFSFVRYRQSS